MRSAWAAALRCAARANWRAGGRSGDQAAAGPASRGACAAGGAVEGCKLRDLVRPGGDRPSVLRGACLPCLPALQPLALSGPPHVWSAFEAGTHTSVCSAPGVPLSPPPPLSTPASPHPGHVRSFLFPRRPHPLPSLVRVAPRTALLLALALALAPSPAVAPGAGDAAGHCAGLCGAALRCSAHRNTLGTPNTHRVAVPAPWPSPGGVMWPPVSPSMWPRNLSKAGVLPTGRVEERGRRFRGQRPASACRPPYPQKERKRKNACQQRARQAATPISVPFFPNPHRQRILHGFDSSNC